MKTAILTLVIAAMALAGGVAPTSCHYTDALAVYRGLSAVGYGDATVGIAELPDVGTMDYFVVFQVPCYDQYDRMFAAMIAVATVSEETNWTSGYVHVVFSDGAVSYTTSDARWLINNFSQSWSDQYLMNWLESHCTVTQL